MFCPECGTRIEDTERFCPECGTAVENTAEEVSVSEPCNEPESSKGESRDFIISCIILTNIERLAETLDTDKESISELLDQFIEIKKSAGIRYRLADVSNVKNAAPQIPRAYRVDEPGDGWAMRR
mgnify:CR=1 FL=1